MTKHDSHPANTETRPRGGLMRRLLGSKSTQEIGVTNPDSSMTSEQSISELRDIDHYVAELHAALMDPKVQVGDMELYRDAIALAEKRRSTLLSLIDQPAYRV